MGMTVNRAVEEMLSARAMEQMLRESGKLGKRAEVQDPASVANESADEVMVLVAIADAQADVRQASDALDK